MTLKVSTTGPLCGEFKVEHIVGMEMKLKHNLNKEINHTEF